MKIKTVQRIYIKMVKVKIKQDKDDDKMKLNKRFSKVVQIAENLNGIRANGNNAIALRSKGNLET